MSAKPLNVVAWTSLFLSGLSFLLFVALVAEKLWVTFKMARRALAEPTTQQPQPGLDTAPQALAGADRVLEALAKLTDSLAKAPMPVVTLVGTVLFLLIALAAAALDCRGCGSKETGDEQPPAAALPTTPERCLVGFFGDGDHRLPAVRHEQPAGCLDTLGRRLRSDQVGLLFLIGRCDIRELRSATRRIYAENLSLAYQRAISVRSYLLSDRTEAWLAVSPAVAGRTVVLPAGASRLGSDLSGTALQEDRVVELVSFWTSSPALTSKSAR